MGAVPPDWRKVFCQDGKKIKKFVFVYVNGYCIGLRFSTAARYFARTEKNSGVLTCEV
jgi:hypothetical protein